MCIQPCMKTRYTLCLISKVESDVDAVWKHKNTFVSLCICIFHSTYSDCGLCEQWRAWHYLLLSIYYASVSTKLHEYLPHISDYSQELGVNSSCHLRPTRKFSLRHVETHKWNSKLSRGLYHMYVCISNLRTKLYNN